MTVLRFLWLAVRLCTAVALLYVSVTLTAHASLAALPLTVIALIFLFTTLQELTHVRHRQSPR